MITEKISAITDNNAELHLKLKPELKNKKVRVVIVEDEYTDDDISEEEWMQIIKSNPVFDFLKEPAEDIYTVHDGKPIVHER